MADLADEQLLSVPRPISPPAIKKKAGYDFWQSIGSPKYIVAPMVDASELAWRILSRSYGAQLVYTPMINATMFNSAHPIYCKEQFDLEAAEEGASDLDRPLVAQFCANDKTQFLDSAMMLASKGVCDAVDLNLGCPQGIAKRGHYGAFLQEDMALIESLIHHLHTHLPVPITAKFRVLETVEATVAYAKMLEKAGAQVLTVHGRLREQKGQYAGLADWNKIKAVKAAVTSIPVVANGNILIDTDIVHCLKSTGCDGVMSAEGNLYNPALFQSLNDEAGRKYIDQLPSHLREAIFKHSTGSDSTEEVTETMPYPPSIMVARRYLAIVRALKTKTAASAVKSHLFKLFRPFFASARYHGIREQLASASAQNFEAIVDELENLFEADDQKNLEKWTTPTTSENLRNAFPFHVCQPYIRFDTLEPARGTDAADERPAKRAKFAPTIICSTPDCQNAGAGKCPKTLCSPCCAKSDIRMCEAHAAKRQKQQDKRDAKKNKRKKEPYSKRANVSTENAHSTTSSLDQDPLQTD